MFKSFMLGAAALVALSSAACEAHANGSHGYRGAQSNFGRVLAYHVERDVAATIDCALVGCGVAVAGGQWVVAAGPQTCVQVTYGHCTLVQVTGVNTATGETRIFIVRN